MEELDFPSIVRARELYVYDTAGNRYLDLYLGGGRLALGHRLSHRLQLIKSLLARGLYGSYPHTLEGRVKKSFLAFWGGGIQVTGFRDRSSAQIFLQKKKGCLEAPELWGASSVQGVARWRLGQDVRDKKISLWAFEPPIPSFLGFLIFFVERTGGSEVELDLKTKVWDAFSLRLVEQSLYALVRERAKPYREPKASLGEGLWKREGQHWLPLYCEKEHEGVWRRFKEKGILLPPRYGDPLTISKAWTQDDQKLFRRAQEAYLEKT